MSAGESVGGNVDESADGAVGRDETVGEQRTTTAGEDGSGIRNGDVFEVLSNRRRRYALHHLMQHEDEPVEMSDLTTKVAAWENGTDPENLSYDQRKTVHTSLYQYHAPKLEDRGFVEYDSQRGVVELTEDGKDLDLYLEAVRGRELPWSSYFVILSTLGAALVGATWLGVPPLGSLPAFASAGFVVSAFLVSSLVFAYDNRTAMRLGSGGPPPEMTEK